MKGDRVKPQYLGKLKSSEKRHYRRVDRLRDKKAAKEQLSQSTSNTKSP